MPTADSRQMMLPIDAIVPNDWNPQKMDSTTFNTLVEEIEEVGFIDALTVVDLEDGTYRIIGGEHRWRAARSIGMTELPALVLPHADWDEDTQKFVTVRLNVLKGDLDPEKFLPLYNEMVDKYGKEAMQRLFAFSDKKALDKAIGKMREGVKETLPPELQDKFERQAKEARSVDELDEIIRRLFNEYGDTLNQSFMIFTYGKYEHIYITMNIHTKKALDKVLQYCKMSGADINDFIAPIMQACATEAIKKMAEEHMKEEEVVEDDVAF
jgi:ParB/RepB/Spo0J family partition protein